MKPRLIGILMASAALLLSGIAIGAGPGQGAGQGSGQGAMAGSGQGQSAPARKAGKKATPPKATSSTPQRKQTRQRIHTPGTASAPASQ